MRILVVPFRNSRTTRSRSSLRRSPWMAVTLYPSRVSSECRFLQRLRVFTKMMVCPRFSQFGNTISFSKVVLASSSGHSTRYCLMTSRESFSFGTNTWFAVGTIFVANRLTRSLNVAENRRIWQLGLCLVMSRIMRIDSSANPSAFSIWSASSKTMIFMALNCSILLEDQDLSLPRVPTTICSFILLLLPLCRSNSAVAVEVKVIPVYFPIFSRTMRFCTTSSRVGQKQMACGACSPGSTLLSIESVKQVVLPLPLWAWAIMCSNGGDRIMGRVDAWIRLGRSNFISL
mmetsp:Transcript_7880/g.22506  ORF Transcript_7880/g.22506 Transcript_7880/m.22506 type:complete len:288 (-) Transcript_7880:621-1484(-)